MLTLIPDLIPAPLFWCFIPIKCKKKNQTPTKICVKVSISPKIPKGNLNLPLQDLEKAF